MTRKRERRTGRWCLGMAACAMFVFAPFASVFAQSEGADGQFNESLSSALPVPEANSVTSQETKAPHGVAPWFAKVYTNFLISPLPGKIFKQGGIPATVPVLERDSNPNGRLQTYNTLGPTVTKNNAFFASLGTNGRNCSTCHLPPDGMSISVRTVNRILAKAGPYHPLFAPVDGANCPSAVKASETSGSLYKGYRGTGKKDFKASHSLLLTKGLIRIPVAVPANAEYTIEVVKDPAVCNSDPNFNTGPNGEKIISVYRRPRMSTNLNFAVTPRTENCATLGTTVVNGNVMWDGREPNLCTQALGATLGHAQADPDPANVASIRAQLDEIVDFETNIYSAQIRDKKAGRLDFAGATGGAVNLASHDDKVLDLSDASATPFDEYDAWVGASPARDAIARGQTIFNTRTFLIDNVAGFSDFEVPGVGPIGNISGTCATCHNVSHAGSDALTANQRDIGVGGQGVGTGGSAPAADLPLFKLTCPAGSFLWDPNLTTVTTNDPGKALITGKCRDIGKFTVPSMRGIAAQEPYFHDGSAKTLLDVVNFYTKRFQFDTPLTAQEKKDLAAFMATL